MAHRKVSSQAKIAATAQMQVTVTQREAELQGKFPGVTGKLPYPFSQDRSSCFIKSFHC